MTRTLAEKLAPNADLKTVVETGAREIAEETQSIACQICLNNPLDPTDTSIYEFRAVTDGAGAELHKTMFPLLNQGALVGTVTIVGSQQLSPDEIGSLSASVLEYGARVHKAQIADVVQRQTFHKTFLTEIDNVMTYSTGVGDALFIIVNILGKVLRVSRCIFVCTDDLQAGWKSYEYWVHDQVQSCQSLNWPATDSALVAQTLLAKEPFVIYATARGTSPSPVQQELQALSVQSLLGMPLKSEGGVHGCVMVQQCDFRRQWKQADISMLQAAADMVSTGMSKLPAEKFAREPIMQLHQQDIKSYKDQESGKKKVDAVRIALKGGSIAAAVVAEPEIAPAAAIPADMLTMPLPEEAKEKPAAKKSKAARPKAPTIVQTKDNLSKEDEKYILATPGLDDKTLARIVSWIRQIESNDKYAKGHAVPVAKYAEATAKQLGLSIEDVNSIRLAALVHDVGKMGISSYILQQEDEDLSDAELLMTMKHPQDGADLLNSFPDLAPVAPLVCAHHEEYDGNGYPTGLQDDDIPFGARILFAANEYHSMISPRKSGAATILDPAAQEQLRAGAGTRFDPRVVEALLRVIKQKSFNEQLAD
jgi:putative nucleotidyltransferase with HDIG domain